VYHDRADVIWVCFERCDLLAGVVVVDSQLEVIAAGNNPVLACNEATSSYRNIGEFECLDDRLCFVRPDVNVAAVEGGEDLVGRQQALGMIGVNSSSPMAR
jgi:hypothetical protein